MKRITIAWFALRTWLVALLPVVPAAAATATVMLYLADWPHPGNHGFQLAVGLGIAGVTWVLAALMFGPDLVNVETASSTSYEDLRGRVVGVEARIAARREYLEAHANGDGPPPEKEALDEASSLVLVLKRDLRLDEDERDLRLDGGDRDRGPRWLLGHGYVNAWRELHQAEDRLLTAEEPEVIFAALSTDPDLAEEVKQAAGNTKIKTRTGADPGQPDTRRGRELVAHRFAELHRAENDAWDQVVNLRNRLFLALGLAVSLTYGVLVLAVLRDVNDAALTAALAFFLAGAVVGVFNELYLSSRPSRRRSLFDYGLGHIRLLVTPIVSGLAGLGGIFVTTLAGPFLIETGGNATVPALAQVFDLGNYSIGLVVAAIFGLTPGLLLTRLHDRGDTYKKQIEEASPESTGLQKPAAGLTEQAALGSRG